jgi:hypothetical protein
MRQFSSCSTALTFATYVTLSCTQKQQHLQLHPIDLSRGRLSVNFCHLPSSPAQISPSVPPLLFDNAHLHGERSSAAHSHISCLLSTHSAVSIQLIDNIVRPACTAMLSRSVLARKAAAFSSARMRSSVLSTPLSHPRWNLRFATTVVKVPQMAESITEGTLKSFSKQVGDFVEQDEEIATIETDKVSLMTAEHTQRRS